MQLKNDVALLLNSKYSIFSLFGDLYLFSLILIWNGSLRIIKLNTYYKIKYHCLIILFYPNEFKLYHNGCFLINSTLYFWKNKYNLIS